MSTTALFVFSESCPSCTMYKQQFHEPVKAKFRELGVRLTEPTTCKTLDGFTKTNGPYAFYSEIDMFPCIMLVNTAILSSYEKGSFQGDILSHLSIWNGQVLPNGAKRIVPASPMKYGSSILDFERFYRDSQATSVHHSKETPTQLMPAGIRTQVRTRNVRGVPVTPLNGK